MLWTRSPKMLRWYTKAKQLIHRPYMIGQPGGHRGGDRLPLFARAFPSFGHERVPQPLAQAAMRDDEVIISERQGQLLLQVVRVFRERIDFAPPTSRVLTD